LQPAANGSILNNLAISIISICCFVPSLVIHEFSHGYAALKMGDPTAKEARRLTLNPLAHIDPFGTILLPLLLTVVGLPAFGYAKPVPYNPNRLRNKRKGELVVGLAGPASNLVLALVSAGIAALIQRYLSYTAVTRNIYLVLFCITLINLCMLFFNMLPIPPLDGSSIIVPLIPDKHLPGWYRMQRKALPILMVLIVVLPCLASFFGIDFDPISAYIQFTAIRLTRFLYSF